jgi:hypothetical protein
MMVSLQLMVCIHQPDQGICAESVSARSWHCMTCQSAWFHVSDAHSMWLSPASCRADAASCFLAAHQIQPPVVSCPGLHQDGKKHGTAKYFSQLSAE